MNVPMNYTVSIAAIQGDGKLTEPLCSFWESKRSQHRILEGRTQVEHRSPHSTPAHYRTSSATPQE